MGLRLVRHAGNRCVLEAAAAPRWGQHRGYRRRSRGDATAFDLPGSDVDLRSNDSNRKPKLAAKNSKKRSAAKPQPKGIDRKEHRERKDRTDSL